MCVEAWFCQIRSHIQIFSLYTEYNNNDRWGHNAQGLVLHKMNCDDVPLNKWNDTSEHIVQLLSV